MLRGVCLALAIIGWVGNESLEVSCGKTIEDFKIGALKQGGTLENFQNGVPKQNGMLADFQNGIRSESRMSALLSRGARKGCGEYVPLLTVLLYALALLLQGKRCCRIFYSSYS